MALVKPQRRGLSGIQFPRGNFKGFIDNIKWEHVTGDSKEANEFKQELADLYFDQWEAALNNLGIKGYTREHIANRYKRITNRSFDKVAVENQAREFEEYADVLFTNYYTNEENVNPEEFNRSLVLKSSYEAKKDFETLKEQVHAKIKEKLINANFRPGSFFIDMKGSDADLLVSLGDMQIARLPMERYNIIDYIDMRYPEEKSNFDIVRKILKEPEDKKSKVDPLNETCAIEEIKELLVKRMCKIQDHNSPEFKKLWDEFGEFVSPKPLRASYTPTVNSLFTTEDFERESELYFKYLQKEVEADTERENFIQSKYWEIVERLELQNAQLSDKEDTEIREWAVDTLPKAIREIIKNDFKWEKSFFSLKDLTFIYSHPSMLWDRKSPILEFTDWLREKYQTVRRYLCTFEPVEVEETPIKKRSNGYMDMIMGAIKQQAVIDIMFCKNTDSHPGNPTNWTDSEWEAWEPVKTIKIKRCLLDTLREFSLDADPNWWFRNSMELEFNRKYKYANATGDSIFVETPEKGSKTMDYYQLSWRVHKSEDSEELTQATFFNNPASEAYLKK